MEADRSGGGPNPNSGGGGSSGAGRNPNGPKPTPSQATSAAAATGAMAAAAATAAAAAAAAVGAMPGSSQNRELQDGDSGMTLPGILHFIQFEWGRFQAEKYRWEAERDELRVNLLFHF